MRFLQVRLLFLSFLVTKFELTRLGRDCNDGQKESISSIEECREAARELGQIFLEYDFSWSDRTKGCISRELHVYWNKHNTGNKHHVPKYSAVCRKTGKYTSRNGNEL